MSSYEEVTAILAQCRISHFRQAFLDNECDDSFLDIVEDGDLRELGLPETSVWADLERLSALVALTLQPVLSRTYRQCFPDGPGRCYQAPRSAREGLRV